MRSYMSSGMNATFSNRSVSYTPLQPSLSSWIDAEQATDGLPTCQAQLGRESFLRGPVCSFGGVERNLNHGRTRMDSNSIHETLYRFPRRGTGNCERRSRGDEGFSEFFNAGQRGRNEQLAAACGENEAADSTRVLLQSSNLSCRDKRLFIFGFGYTSCALASFLKNSWNVSGTCRTEEKRAALEQRGYSAHVFNSDNDGEELREEGLRKLQQASHWLISVAPVADFDNDPVLTTHIQDLKHAVGQGNVRWIGYLSSTGIYGDWQGDWVDEEANPRPMDQRAMARLAAEDSWLKFGLDHGVPVVVFRLGGIYGPGRSAIDTVLKNQKLSARQRNREQRRFTSRIHVADVCQTVLASMQKPNSRKIYNVVDDDPASRTEVLSYAVDLLNSQEINSRNPHPKKASSSPKMALGENNLSSQRMGEKRVSNERIKLDLKVKLLYPTYRQGLKTILELRQRNS